MYVCAIYITTQRKWPVKLNNKKKRMRSYPLYTANGHCTESGWRALTKVTNLSAFSVQHHLSFHITESTLLVSLIFSDTTLPCDSTIWRRANIKFMHETFTSHLDEARAKGEEEWRHLLPSQIYQKCSSTSQARKMEQKKNVLFEN